MLTCRTQFAGAFLRHFQKRNKMPSHPVVFESRGGIPVDQKVTEGMDILIAGADTTALTLTTGFLHILKYPEIRRKLLESRRQAFPSATKQPVLRQVERSTICTRQTSPSRPRQSSERLTVDGQIVATGTFVSMLAYSMHTRTEAWGTDASGFYLDLRLHRNKKGLEQYL
ncbi:hypothetical protein ASPCAL05056 [Aspergillus calidoustus]|uniref:Cytochrome P450 n=1 Tax=Aspergillus calidoustus TaxID=454130 RepID=A0A0U5G309_ASPCI|nr:hypothetical protein ASPCAL05056 [Aspergillus calidoustus]